MDISNVETKIKNVEEDMKQTLQIVTEIKMALTGSEQLGIEGIVNQVRRHEDYIEKDKKQKWLLSGAVMILASGIGAFWNKIFN